MNWDPIHDTRRTFRALLAAQCDPGARVDLPVGDTEGDAWRAVLHTLVDATTATTVLGDDATTIGWLTELGIIPVDLARAEFVIARTDVDLSGVPRGTALDPDTGATVLLGACPDTSCELTGPGLPVTTRRRLPIQPATIRARNAACVERPRGIDLVVIGAGALWAIPRSTRVTEVN